jgi:hypothetical protein
MLSRKLSTALVATLALLLSAASANAATAPGLGSASTFAVLAGTTVTNTGPSVIKGDLGVSPGTAVTGFPPGTVSAGSIHSADAVASGAQDALTTGYNSAASAPTTATVPDVGNIGGETLVPGVYTSASSMMVDGTVTLNGGGDPNAVWIFKAGSTLVTGSASRVVLEDGAQPCNVYWQVGSSATLGTGSTFVGTIMALTSITVTTDVTVAGRALARNGAVTLDSDTIAPQACGATVTPPPVVVPVPVTKAGAPGQPVATPPVVVTLPAPGCGCVTAPGGTTPAAAKYVIIGQSKHCHVTINQTTGKVTFRADKGHYGAFTVTVQHGMTVTVVHFAVKKKVEKTVAKRMKCWMRS